MIQRVWAIAMNTYREAVRARILHGLAALALLTVGYALIVSAFTLNNQSRAVVNIGTAALSVYGIVVSILLGATSLYRELELKTIFPILGRPIHRGEYILGKFLGTLLVLAVFITANAAVLLFAVASLGAMSAVTAVLLPLGIVAALVLVGFLRRGTATWLPVPGALILLIVGVVFARDEVNARAIVLGSSVLSLLEVSIMTAVTLTMASFSSPFLTGIFSLGILIVGRSADSLAKLPARMFGEAIHTWGVIASHVVPNLMVYVPQRRILAGEVTTIHLPTYFGQAAIQAAGWTVLLLVLATLIFRRRDFL